REPHGQLLADLHLELASVQLYRELTRGSGDVRRDGGPGRAGPRGERLPHAALEDPRAHPVSLRAEEAHVGPVREQLTVLDLRADRGQLERPEAVPHRDRALGIADRDVLEAPGPPPRLELAATVVGAGREILRSRARPPHLQRALPLGAD